MFFVSLFASLLVGSVFLFVGIGKILSPATFIAYLSHLNIKLLTIVPLPLVAIFIGLIECVIGSALIFQVFRNHLFLISISLLGLFSLLAAWGMLVRKIGACACYGEKFKLSPMWSMILSGLYIVFLIVAWCSPEPFTMSLDRQAKILLSLILFFSLFVGVVIWRRRVRGLGLADNALIKKGNFWNNAWLDGFTEHAIGEQQLIVLLHPDCSFCKKWINVLTKISRRSDVPQLIVGLAGGLHEVNDFRGKFNIAFPLLPVELSTMARLVDAYPTVVLTKNNKIETIDVGRFPQELIRMLSPQRESVGLRI